MFYVNCASHLALQRTFDDLIPRRRREEVLIMSTYEGLSLIVSIRSLTAAILNMKNKK